MRKAIRRRWDDRDGSPGDARRVRRPGPLDEARDRPPDATGWAEEDRPGRFAFGVAPGLIGLLALVALGFAATADRRPAASVVPATLLAAGNDWHLSVLDRAADRLIGIDYRGNLGCIHLGSGRTERWGGFGEPNALALDPPGATLAVGSGDGEIALVDANTGSPRFRIPTSGGVGGPAVLALAFHPDGRTLVAGLADGTIRFHDATDGRRRGEVVEPRGGVTHLAFGPTGDVLVSASADGTVRLRDGSTGRPTRAIIEAQAPVRDLAIAPDGRTLALSLGPRAARSPGQIPSRVDTTGRGMIRSHLVLIDLADPARGERPLAQSGFDAVAFAPDGRTLLAGGNEGVVRFWDVESGTLLATGEGHQGCISRVHVTGDGRRAVTVGMDCLVGLFDLARDDGTS